MYLHAVIMMDTTLAKFHYLQIYAVFHLLRAICSWSCTSLKPFLFRCWCHGIGVYGNRGKEFSLFFSATEEHGMRIKCRGAGAYQISVATLQGVKSRILQNGLCFSSVNKDSFDLTIQVTPETYSSCEPGKISNCTYLCQQVQSGILVFHQKMTEEQWPKEC